ncbi:Hypothetical protein PHPALM_8883 [Phytophthora palmivora]|uniref:Reverse transcriptase RNase H-like domain-containing protein n=1 Tax=Phytophthora palmivora TaxID=4796 RepID=A0A2P4Y8S2_9STRA|nr:Hypothetical protein PHPALM_8883 [Phytophthora palmivora]
MEDVVQTEPKRVVGYLLDALRPQAFKAAVKYQLGRQAYKPTKASIQTFLKWLRKELEGFMKFEAHSTVQQQSGQVTKSTQSHTTTTQPKKSHTGASHNTKACGDQTYGVFQCPDIVSQVEAKELYEKCTCRKVMKPVMTIVSNTCKKEVHSAGIPCKVMDLIETLITPDSAAEVSVVTTKLLKALSRSGVWINYLEIADHAAVTGIGDKPMSVKNKVKLKLRFTTPGGPLTLHNVICWVTDQRLPSGVGELLLSKWIMQKLGYSPGKRLAVAQQISEEWDMNDVDDGPMSKVASVLACAGGIEKPERTPEERELEDAEYQAFFPDFINEIDAEREEIRIILMEKVDETRSLGATEEFTKELKYILMQIIEVFRIFIGRDPPVDMPPMKVKLKPGAVPSSSLLTQSPLITAGLCYRNPKSSWCSTPLIVNKPEVNAFRMTVGPNDYVESIVLPMPILETAFEQLRGSSRVAYVQSTVQEMFSELFNNGLMIWIEDLLGYEDSDQGLLVLLRKVLQVCADKGLKLNPKKCNFYLREALWCGRMVSGDGIRHDPARIEALTNFPEPTTDQELQQFVCALNWMRTSLPAFNKLTAPLYDRAAGRKKTQVRAITLCKVGWGAGEAACIEKCKIALQNALCLAHPDPTKLLTVYTDASDEHWGAVITQIPHDQATRPISEQEHEPLMMLSGSFSGEARRWAIVEKEAYATVETCRRANYLLHRPDGFALFTDHRNLCYIFDPHSVSASVPKCTADKLHRWSLLLMGYQYEIHDISGDENVWADLLSRWGL